MGKARRNQNLKRIDKIYAHLPKKQRVAEHRRFLETFQKVYRAKMKEYGIRIR